MIKKNDLVEKIAEKTGATKKETGAFLESALDVIAESLGNGETVDLFGFGKFEVGERSARTGVNPSTGEKIQIPASKTIKFKAAKALKESVK